MLKFRTTIQDQLPIKFSKDKLAGILLPIPTPFSSHGDLDLQSLRTNLNNWNRTGISGYVVLGSTGERAHLDEREYLQVIEAARTEVDSQRAFIVGAGQHSTIKTIAEVKAAAKAGAEAVLVLTPHYYRPAMSQDVLLDYYRSVADA
jgi:4-hydroxy-2-oxoglutarate aldolase